MSKITGILTLELLVWTGRYRESNDLSNQIARVGFDLAIASLDGCIRLLAVDRTEQVLELAKVILDKSVSLSGGEGLKLLYDALKAPSEIHDVLNSGRASRKTTAKTLSEIELFTATALFSTQYAVAQVRALTDPISEPVSRLPLNEGGRIVMHNAKQVVVRYLLEARRELAARQEAAEKGSSESCVLFPIEGLWPGATVRLPFQLDRHPESHQNDFAGKVPRS
jgi:hypothetical protein